MASAEVRTAALKSAYGQVDRKPRRPRQNGLANCRDVIAISNSTAFSLSSGVCTNDLRRAIAFIDGLYVGTCNIREQPGQRIELSRSVASRTVASRTVATACRKVSWKR